MGGLDEEVKDQKEETKIVDLDEEKKKRKPFHYWTVGGRDYRLKLKASNIEKLENKYKCNVMHLVDDMPALSVMLTIIQAAMLPWEHGVKYDDILNLFDKYVEEGGSQIDLYKNVVIPTLAVSGFLRRRWQRKFWKQQTKNCNNYKRIFVGDLPGCIRLWNTA